tara:strand:+ start:877 stop:1044 length:168 start_codon:yes stop_codon:yes gene_type:complete
MPPPCTHAHLALPAWAQPGVPIDTESTGVVIKEPSFWEKATNSANESGFLRGFGR